MPSEKFLLKDEIHEIEVNPITLIFKHPDCNFDIEPISDRVVIDPETTIHYNTDRWHPLTKEWVEKIKPNAFTENDLASRHLRGLVDLSLRYKEIGVQFMWRYPETYLHPAQQCELADFLLFLTKGG